MRGRLLSSTSSQHYEDYEHDDSFSPPPRILEKAGSDVVDNAHGDHPLLFKVLQGEDDGDFERVDEDDASVWRKVWKVLELAVPTMITMVILMLQEVVNLIFIGHLNNPAMLAGVGIGNLT